MAPFEFRLAVLEHLESFGVQGIVHRVGGKIFEKRFDLRIKILIHGFKN